MQDFLRKTVYGKEEIDGSKMFNESTQMGIMLENLNLKLQIYLVKNIVYT